MQEEFDIEQQKLIPTSIEEMIPFQNIVEMVKKIIHIPHGLTLVTGLSGSGRMTFVRLVIDHLLHHRCNLAVVAEKDSPLFLDNATTSILKIPVGYGTDKSPYQGVREALSVKSRIVIVEFLRDSNAELIVKSAIAGQKIIAIMNTILSGVDVFKELQYWGIPVSLSSKAINGVISLALMQRLCNYCKYSYKPDKDILKSFRIPEYYEDKVLFYRSPGCPQCRYTMVQGWQVVFDILVMNDLLIELLSKRVGYFTIKETIRKNYETIRSSTKKSKLNSDQKYISLLPEFINSTDFNAVSFQDYALELALAGYTSIESINVFWEMLDNILESERTLEQKNRELKIANAQLEEALMNLEIAQKELIESKKLERDLEISKEIQKNLLPPSNPIVIGFDVAGVSFPAESVGGDYYDFIRIDSDRFGIVLGDVSGKGIPGALIMAICRSVVRSEIKDHINPATVLEGANISLYEDIPKKMFVSLIYSVLNNRHKTITYSNAGQTPPLIYRKSTGKCEYFPFQTVRFPLGSIKKVRYTENTISVNTDDIIVFYTDGVLEAMNPKSESYGSERLEKIISENSSANADELIRIILEDIKDFIENTPLFDDLTLVVVKVK